MKDSFKGQRAVLTHVMTIESTPETVFPLLCPVREEEWAPGWVGRVIFAESGLAEEDGVFASVAPDRDDTVWYVTRRDASRHELEFVFFMPGLQVSRLNINVTPVSETRSTLWIRYIRTGISERGNESVREAETRFPAMVSEWKESLNHFVSTGMMMEGVE